MTPGSQLDVALEYALSDPPSLHSVEGKLEQVLGFLRDDLLSSRISFREQIHPDDEDIASALFSAAGEPAGTVCLRVRHADGRIRCLKVEFTKRIDDGASRLRLRLGEAGEMWRRSGRPDPSANLRTLIENTEDEIHFKNRCHVYVAASARFRAAVEDYLGGRDLIGLTDYDFLPEHEADSFYRTEKQAICEAAPVHEIHAVERDHLVRWIEALEHPVKSDTGEVVGLFATVRNLTVRIHAEEDVEEPGAGKSQSPANIGSYLLDVRRGAFATSAALDSILGVDSSYPHDLQGWERLIYPDDRGGMLAYMESVIATPGRIFNREYRILRPLDGEIRWAQGIGRVERDAQGRPLLVRGTVQDITERKRMEAALRETSERLQIFIEHAPAALAMFDREMRYLAVSRRWEETYGVSPLDLLGRCHYDVVPDLPERWKVAHARGLAGESLVCEEDRFDRADGSVLWIRWEIRPWHQADGSVGGIVLFAEDITQSKRAEQRLKLAASMFANASEAIFVSDLKGNIVEVNDAFTRVTGYGREEVLGQTSHILKSEHHDAGFYGEMERSVLQTGRWRGEQWFRRKDGTAFEVGSTITTVFDSLGKPAHYVAMFFDISPMREQERKLEQVIRFDELTGLPNRAQVTERLRNAIAAVPQSKQMVGVIFFDLDDFKFANEVHGREAADGLLVAVAARMKQVLREGDTLGRIGGDEFLVVLPNLAGQEAASHVVERLLRAIHDPSPLGSALVQLSATAGAAFYPQAEEVDADQLIRQAVQAMYEAKLAGKDRYLIFDPARDYNLRGRHEEAGRIRQALKANEFVLHYQPKVNMANGTLVGAEALIRWQHPQRGLLLPGLFLPVIEDRDLPIDRELAVEVGEWVIETALRQIDAWAQEGRRIPVSVNVSASHLQQADFVDRLCALLNAHPAVDRTCLELEILETSTVHDLEHVSRIIGACMGMGISVAIDDFGTGYSSLSYLKRLPATVLKIDQSFVRDMLEDPDDMAILQGILGLSNAFRRMAVAEGVETVEQGHMLLRLGCTFAQGYGIARPMPAEQLIPWYSNWWPDPSWMRVPPVTAQDWPILVAEIELGAWSRSLEQFMSGIQPNAPELDDRRCRFGAWLSGEKLGPRAALPALSRMEMLHHKSHAAAQQAVDMKQCGRMSEAATLTRNAIRRCREMEAELRALLPGESPAAVALHRAQ
ncbi:MAG TPA: EAL domain-containing protein [Terracidiphilus sp.]|jgi:diguanylate cyclase (GGDEF)-like protein/PAS domain S-box-containing protein|nr:EAL domain-containing protein [Terracidiphilus sp.]